MISKEKIDEIRDRSDIVSLISEHVALKRTGASFVGLCPFHAEKTPSFHVHPERQFFHCFGCKASGDVIRFFILLEARSFPEVVEMLAERAGVELPKSRDIDDDQYRQRREREERLVALMDAATGFFIEQLRSPGGNPAREELARRSIHDETGNAFRLGYAPEAWDSLSRFLAQKGWSPAEAEAVGLLVPRRNGDGHYDRFRQRLMFPIADVHGRLLAFSGRLLQSENSENQKDSAKYVNSPESPLYRKGDVLYGLYEGRVAIRREGWSILCEGNFDVLALHQAGFPNTVAPMGTALTDRQAKLLRRYAPRVVILFDGDHAGRKATAAAHPILRREGIAAQVVAFPAGHDPDSYLREYGVAALRERIETAPGIVEYLIDAAAGDIDGTAASVSSAIEELGPVVATVDNPVEERLYIERIGRRFGISDLAAVRRQLVRGARSPKVGSTPTSEPSNGRATKAGARQGAPLKLPPLELELFGVFLDNPEFFSREEAKALDELLTSSELRAIFHTTGQLVEARGAVDATQLLGEVSGNPAVTWLEERLAIQKYDRGAGEKALRDGIPRLARYHIEQELPRLQRKILDARRLGDETRATELTKQHVALFRSARKLMQGIQR